MEYVCWLCYVAGWADSWGARRRARSARPGHLWCGPVDVFALSPPYFLFRERPVFPVARPVDSVHSRSSFHSLLLAWPYQCPNKPLGSLASAGITQTLRRHYANKWDGYCPCITQPLCSHYAAIMQIPSANYAKIMPTLGNILRKQYVTMRQHYANSTYKSRNSFTQNTQALYKSVYAGIAQISLWFTKLNYAQNYACRNHENKITP